MNILSGCVVKSCMSVTDLYGLQGARTEQVECYGMKRIYKLRWHCRRSIFHIIKYSKSYRQLRNAQQLILLVQN